MAGPAHPAVAGSRREFLTGPASSLSDCPHHDHPTATSSPTPTSGTNKSVHVGDLGTNSTSSGGRWSAVVIITVHDASETPLQGVTVYGSWGSGTNGSGSCVTGSNGRCSISKDNLKANISSVTFTVTTLSTGMPYQSSSNHDPDGDSNGTTIMVSKP